MLEKKKRKVVNVSHHHNERKLFDLKKKINKYEKVQAEICFFSNSFVK